jgi:hypothetical protein
MVSIQGPARAAALFLGLLGAAGCTPPMIHTELGAPTHRYEGRTLVVLPRTCIVEKSVPPFHFASRPSPLTADPTQTTGRLRKALDGLVTDAAPRATRLKDGRPIDACPSSPPDLTFETGWLAEVQASDDTLRLMRDRGADHVVVLEVHTVMACARRQGVEMLPYTWSAGGTFQGRSFATIGSPPAPRWSPDDVCLEDEITLSATLFRDDGKAVWTVSRDVGLEDEVGWVVDRVLERVPAVMPARLRRTDAPAVELALRAAPLPPPSAFDAVADSIAAATAGPRGPDGSASDPAPASPDSAGP